MRVVVPAVAFVFFFAILDYGLPSCIAATIWVSYVTNFFLAINSRIAFKEYILVMYGLNYLFSAAIQYHMPGQQYYIYRMRLSEADYFSLAIPAMLAFQVGLSMVKTKIFTPNFNLSSIEKTVNENVLKTWMIGGFFITFFGGFLPAELAFLAYLIGGVRYVGAFGLFIIDRKKYKWYLLVIVFLEIANSLRMAMFHDMIIWVLFFGMVWTYMAKPSVFTKTILTVVAVICFYTLQVTKSSYRAQMQGGEGGSFSSFSSVVSQNAESNAMFSDDNTLATIARANQGWIFSSAVNTMNFRGNYQENELLKKYFEAAVLPRFLAPDKLEAGDKEIFNKFSGIKILGNTSMGLGVFADGYIAYGTYGVFIYAFVFGLIFSLVFKVLEKWSRISPFFVLLMFVILNFAVRADCETQTWMGHLIKGVIVFSLIMYFYRQHFAKYLSRNTRQEEENEASLEGFQGQVAV